MLEVVAGVVLVVGAFALTAACSAENRRLRALLQDEVTRAVLTEQKLRDALKREDDAERRVTAALNQAIKLARVAVEADEKVKAKIRGAN